MNIYLLTQDENNHYDTYDSMVVAASSEEAARNVNPSIYGWGSRYTGWASKPENVNVELIGIATRDYEDGEIILSSFNAG